MAASAPSTVAANPLEDSLAKIMGTNTTASNTSLLGYDPSASFRQPEADVISIYGDPGTGATTAETWAQQNELARQAQEQLEFEYAQSQDVLAQQLAQAAEARAAEQMGLTQQTTAQQLASGALGMTSEALGQQQTQQAMGIATTTEARAAEKAAADIAYQKQAMDLAAQKAEQDAAESWLKTFGYSAAELDAMKQGGNLRTGYTNAIMGIPGMTAGQQRAAEEAYSGFLASPYAAPVTGGGGAIGVGSKTGGGTAGTITPEGYYIPAGGSQRATYIGKPGSASYTSYMKNFSKGV